MAFISSLLSTSFIPSSQKIGQVTTRLPPNSSQRNQTSEKSIGVSNLKCLARSHPHGRGGISPTADWSDYDADALAKELEEARREVPSLDGEDFETSKEWVMLVNPRILAEDSKLYEESVAKGCQIDFSKEYLIMNLLNSTAEETIEKECETLWMVTNKEDINKSISFEMLGGETPESSHWAYLCFGREKEAEKFLVDLNDNNFHIIQKKMNDIKLQAKTNNKMLAYILPNSIISPTMLKISC